jgi:hypothetical protein
MKFEIKQRCSGDVIFSIEADNWRLAIAAAIGAKANLRSADLSYANLSYADLRSADLSSANLSYADLSSANLSYTNLRYTDLSYADLSSANLSSADLSYANLSYAVGIDKFPISVSGHMHTLCTMQDGRLSIGCHVHTFAEWKKYACKIGKAEGYSETDVEIYKLHIAHIEAVSKLLWKGKPEA